MSERQTLLLELAYEGAGFHGVQLQPGLRTVASDLTAKLTHVCGQAPRALTFAARTDAGVHAAQNFATCWYRGHTLTPMHLGALTQPTASANATVVSEGYRSTDTLGTPDGSPISDRVHIVSAHFVPRRVNARNQATHKHYQYRIRSEVPRAQLRRDTTHWELCPALRLEPMQRAARVLTGTHDYSAFRSLGCDGKNPIKTISSFTISQADADFVLDVQGTAFLRHMVRILVGTVVEVGAGLRSVDSVQTALDAKNRFLAGMTAPARGLWLMAVGLDATSDDRITRGCL